MKATPKTIAMMRDLITRALTYLQIDSSVVDGDGPRLEVWLWIYAEIAYTDDHPRFENRCRIFPHDFDFPLYPDGTNDDSLKTALRHAMKEVYVEIIH